MQLDLANSDPAFLAFCWSNLSPRARATVMAKAPKTVWLFGAGASHHYAMNTSGIALPLANGFFEAFNALPTSEGFQSHVGPLISFLGAYRGVRPIEVSNWTENIEDFMTSIEDELAVIKEKKSRGQLGQEDMLKGFSLASVYGNMNFILANVINEAQNGPSGSAYRYLLDFCGPNDAFITFNWDTLLDRALVESGGWSPNDGYGLKFAAVMDGKWKDMVEGGATPFATKWTLLKLHGSTNWLVPYAHVHFETFEYLSSVPESDAIFLYWQSTLPYATHKSRWTGGYVPTCYCYYPPNLPGEAFSAKQLSPGPGRMWVRYTPIGVFSPFAEPAGEGIPASPLLITPVRQKKYDMYEATINRLWEKAAEELRDAKRLVIAGYSFPRTDLRVLELLKRTLREVRGSVTVEIVAPDAEDIIARIGDKYLSDAKSVTLHAMKFEDYIEVLGRSAPAMMSKAAEDDEQVINWLTTVHALSQVSAAGQLQMPTEQTT